LFELQREDDVEKNVDAEVRVDGGLEAARGVEITAGHSDNTAEQNETQQDGWRDRDEKRCVGRGYEDPPDRRAEAFFMAEFVSCETYERRMGSA
jgi:hypothetical protein